jgi:hypothetical protein
MLLRIGRVLLMACCVALVAQQSNLGSLIFGDECYDGCPDDTGSHRCPLGCTACGCVGHGSPLMLGALVPDPLRLEVARVERDDTVRLPDPHPVSIFHVPKPILV